MGESAAVTGAEFESTCAAWRHANDHAVRVLSNIVSTDVQRNHALWALREARRRMRAQSACAYRSDPLLRHGP